MSLDEEIALYQFAQGVRSGADPLEYHRPADEPERMRRLLDVNTLVRQLNPTDADAQQALADSSLTTADIAPVFMKNGRLTFVIDPMMTLRGDDYEKAYTFQLYLFRAIYQRHVPVGNPAWRYRDLSSPDVVQDIQTRHRALVEEIYTNPSYRSEFDHITKLWYEQIMLRRAERQEPASEPQTHFTFISYDEMITESIRVFADKHAYGMRVLRHSLGKALAKRYGFETNELNRIILEVIGRHMRDTYNTDLFGE